jgi:hypothetical protein
MFDYHWFTRKRFTKGGLSGGGLTGSGPPDSGLSPETRIGSCSRTSGLIGACHIEKER